MDVVLSKSGRGILRDMQKQSPTPTPTSSSLLKLVQVQSQVGVEFDKRANIPEQRGQNLTGGLH